MKENYFEKQLTKVGHIIQIIVYIAIMTRFGLGGGKPDSKLELGQSLSENSADQETGDASSYHPIGHFSPNDEFNSVSKQKRDFILYLNSKKKLEASEMSEPSQDQPWEYTPDLKCIVELDGKYQDGWLDDCSLSAGSDGDNFNKVFNAKSPSAEKAVALLDELVEIRVELFDRIQELGKFKQDVREIGKMLRDDPWEKVQSLSTISSQQSAARTDKVLGSVELAVNRIESICGELDRESSHTFLT